MVVQKLLEMEGLSSISSSVGMSKGGNECLLVATHFYTFNIFYLSTRAKSSEHFTKT